MKLYDYTGVIHFHSSYSFDGRVDVERILKAAGETGLDFLMLTDHSTLGAKRDGKEGWHGRVLLIVGQEISPRFNHYLAFGVDEEIVVDKEDEQIPPHDYMEQVHKRGGIGFIAHPDHEGAEMFHVKHFPWQDWSVAGYTGMGIWDFMTDWQSSLRSIPRALAGYLLPAYVLRGPRTVTLERWDRLNTERKVVGIGELDNHDTPYTVGGITLGIFPFRRAFRFVRTHLLLDAPLSGRMEEDKERLLGALAGGRAYIAMEYFRTAKGFSLILSDGDREVTMGDALALRGKGQLRVRVPHPGRIRIIHDGRLYGDTTGTEMECAVTQRGLYRAEVSTRVRGKARPWIFSNPVYVV